MEWAAGGRAGPGGSHSNIALLGPLGLASSLHCYHHFILNLTVSDQATACLPYLADQMVSSTWCVACSRL